MKEKYEKSWKETFEALSKALGERGYATETEMVNFLLFGTFDSEEIIKRMKFKADFDRAKLEELGEAYKRMDKEFSKYK